MMNISRRNNFDLLRILAAIQVLIFHSVKHLSISDGWLKFFINEILVFFPGVPIFFTISGFLVYWSFDRNSDNMPKYFWHRALRIFPALWVCVAITFGLLLYDLDINIIDALKDKSILAWLGTQFSFLQFYTPEVFRPWGVHAPNGSLWTIPVELQFYILIPILYFSFRMLKNKWLIALVLFFGISVASNLYFGAISNEQMVRKLANVSLLPYLYYFLLGVLAYKFWDHIKFVFEGKFLFWFIGFLAYSWLFSHQLELYNPYYFIGNIFNFVSHLLLAGLTLSAAYTNVGLGSKFLKGNDISYGVYIYHMPVVNYLVHREQIQEPYLVFVVLLVSVILAYLSWKFIEKKALGYKNLLFNKKRN